MFYYEVIFTNGFRGEYGSYIQNDDYVKSLAEEHYGTGSVKSVRFLEVR